MRLVTTLDNDEQAATSGDAIASACLFGILGAMIFGLAVAISVPAILAGATMGLILGIVVAYH